MLRCFVVPFALVAGFSFLTEAATAAEVWTAEGFKNPESVLYDEARQIFYVSNVNGAPTDKDGAGHISKLTADGSVQEAEWVTGLDAPKGLVMRGDQLFVSDIDRLVAIDVNKGEIAGTWNAEGAKFLNDTAVDSDGRVYVSDMGDNAIYRLENGNFTLWLKDKALEFPNGLMVQGDRLVVASWGVMTKGFETKVPGHLKSVSITTKEVMSLGNGLSIGNLDGLEADGPAYLVTDWMAGSLLRIGASGRAKIVMYLKQGSADHEFIESKRQVIIPMMMDGKVTSYKID